MRKHPFNREKETHFKNSSNCPQMEAVTLGNPMLLLCACVCVCVCVCFKPLSARQDSYNRTL